MILDNLCVPALALLLSLTFIAIFVVYGRHYNNNKMQVLFNEPSILPAPPSNISPTFLPNDKLITQTDTASDIGVLSYLIYQAMGNHDSKVIPDRSLPIVVPPAPRLAPQTRSSHKRGSRGGRSRGKHPKQTHPRKLEPQHNKPSTLPPPAPAGLPRSRQPYDYYLVFDVEATCVQGQDFNWCNEIIEFPVVLLRWSDKSLDGKASTLVKVDEFHTFVRPTFRPTLSPFCTSLTGITQANVDTAPTFEETVLKLKEWLVKHQLIDPRTERKLQRFMWCTDGPFDIRDFVVKQCFISKLKVPLWLRTDVMDVRRVVTNWAFARELQYPPNPLAPLTNQVTYPMTPKPQHVRRPSLNITSQLNALSLPPFEGRQHSGIDDTRNIARIVTELARIGFSLESNLNIDPGRRWYWMGARLGEIWEEYL